MTNRDMAALRLAYECLRRGGRLPIVEAMRALDLGDRDAQWLKWAVEERGADGDTSFPRGHLGVRLLRARMALLLRAILRADARDFGAARCSGCRCVTRSERVVTSGWCGCCEHDAQWTRRRITPLWEQARRHEP